ncbi:sortase B protein-sorting domain-containing protein [Holdemanella biformis]|uniref:sortase B protein-sorting domain-containing protein n=1 Tax=Holdemanella biformis TaxID=1735 RepID=UPI003AB68D46
MKEEKDKTPAKTGDNTQLAVFAIFFLLYGIYLLRRIKKRVNIRQNLNYEVLFLSSLFFYSFIFLV